MPDPQLFFLSLAPRSVPDQEVPPGWRNWEADAGRAFEVAPGVRVALLGTGDFTLPCGTIGRGAGIAVWTDDAEAAAAEWGVRFSPGSGRPRDLLLGTRDDAQESVTAMREERPEWGAALIAREPERPAGPWRLAEQEEGEADG